MKDKIDIDEVYKRATTRKIEDGFVSVSCRLGLWSVIADTGARADVEARHYFIQYFHDGEYKEFE